MPYQPFQGFIVGPPSADQTGVTTALNDSQAVLLQVDVAEDAKSEALPFKAYWSHLTVGCAVTAGSPTTLKVQLYKDAACEEPLTGLSGASSIDAVTGATNRGCGIALGVYVTEDSDWTASGRVYALFKTDAGTVTIRRASVRLYWRVES